MLAQVKARATQKSIEAALSPSHGPFVFKIVYSPQSDRLALGWLLRRLKMSLVSCGFFNLGVRLITAWRLPKSLRNSLVRSRLSVGS